MLRPPPTNNTGPGARSAGPKRRIEGKSDGEIAFGALKGFLDVRYGARDGSASAEFSWEGHDENDPACGRGWVMIGTAGRLVGHFYIHNGDNSGFVCERG